MIQQEKDFILRIIQEATQVIARILKLKSTAQNEKISLEINEFFNKEFLVDLDILILDKEQFVQSIIDKCEGNLVSIKQVADILYEKYSIPDNNDLDLHYLDTVFHLLLYIDESSQELDFERIDLMSRIKNKLTSFGEYGNFNKK